MNLLYFLMILFYWVFLSGVIFLAGAYTSRLYVTGPSGVEACFPGGRNKCFGETVAKYIFLIAVLTLFANSIHFILHCAVMTDTSLKEVFSILPTFITKTKYGRFTILRTAFLAVIVVVSFAGVFKDRKGATLSGAVFSLLLLVVIAMSGHQGAMGYMNFPFFLDALHIVSISLWIGGIIFIRFFLSAFARGAYIEFWRNVTSLMNRFSLLATYCVFIAAFTGVLLSYFNVKDFSVLMNTSYGMVLLVKILLVGIIVIIGGMNKFSVIPYMNNIKPEERLESLAHGRKLLNLVTIEAGLGFVVLLLTSILTHLSPEGG
jgi:putative copper resistance protein D